MNKEWFARHETRLRRYQGCLTDCVAYFLNIHPERVPYFVYPREGWGKRLRAFFKKHGYEVNWQKGTKVPRRGTVLVCGDSLTQKTYAHCVVYGAGRLVYDPDYPSRWKDSRITHYLRIKKL